jgi:hypothetical protein
MMESALLPLLLEGRWAKISVMLEEDVVLKRQTSVQQQRRERR